MKIGQPADKTGAAPAAGTHRAANATPAKNATTQPVVASDAESSAKVELSSAASALRSTQKASAPEFDSAKVEQMSAAIKNGTYKVNPEKIADKLIANAQELLTKVAP